MTEAATGCRQAVVERVLRGAGTASEAARRAAFDNQSVDAPARALVDAIAQRAWTVSDADVAATKAAGVSEDQIFELAVCAALGQATRQIEAALAALEAATTPDTGTRHDATLTKGQAR
jgi:alkylhydroperoxidase family enzyme